MLIDLNATATEEIIMSDPTKSEAADQIDAEAAGTPTTDKHISLAKEIEKFAGEVEADVDEAWYAFKAFVLAKVDPKAKAGDPVPLAPESTPEAEAKEPDAEIQAPATDAPAQESAPEAPAPEVENQLPPDTAAAEKPAA